MSGVTEGSGSCTCKRLSSRFVPQNAPALGSLPLRIPRTLRGRVRYRLLKLLSGVERMMRTDVDAEAERRIDAVVFDLGNVLIDWNPRHLYRKLFGNDTEGMERFLAEVCHGAWNERQDAGRTWQEGIEEAIARYPEHEELIRAYRLRWDEMLGGPIVETVAVLDELRKTDTRLLALTNWSRETFPIALERYDFLHWFEGIVVSGEERLIKPDPAIFRLLISRYGLDANRTVFIDDSPRNVDGARQAGLHAILFEGADALRASLRSVGLMIDEQPHRAQRTQSGLTRT